MEDIKNLQNPLTREDIDFRVAQVYKAGEQIKASVLAYKDARVDMKRLDEVVGPLNWQVRYERDSKGMLQCGIGVLNTMLDTGQDRWVWKWSNGTASNFEAEKGEYSDAFKRAGFMWGIGRQLYDFPQISIVLNDKDYKEYNGKLQATGWFRPNEFVWDISPDYKTVTARRNYGGKLKEVFNSNPYKKKTDE